MLGSLWHDTARSNDLCTGTGDCLPRFDLVEVLLAKIQLEGGIEATMPREKSVAKRSRCLLVQGRGRMVAGADLQKFGDCVLTPADAPVNFGSRQKLAASLCPGRIWPYGAATLLS